MLSVSLLFLADCKKDKDDDLFFWAFAATIGNQSATGIPGTGQTDTNAPAEVTSLVTTPADGQIVLTWIDPLDADLDHIEISWSPGGSATQSVPRGVQSFTAAGLSNATTYTFNVKTADSSSNLSAGVSVDSRPIARSICTLAEAGADYGGPATGKLLITEVGTQLFITSNWVEIHNGTNAAVNLSDYSLKVSQTWSTLNSNFGGVRTFTLPSLNVPAGAYIVIRGKSSSTKIDNDLMVSIIGADSYFPFWQSNGFIELLKNGATVDFVSFGTNAVAPVTASEWSGSGTVALASSATQTLQRNTAENDTNTSADWSLVTGITPFLTNDASCSADADFDGIPDCAEAQGKSYMGLPYYAWGARAGQTDMFVELDYMDQSSPLCTSCPDVALAPDEVSLQKLEAVYKANGIVAHFDAGDLFDNDGVAGNNFARYDMCNAGKTPFMTGVTFTNPPPAGVNFFADVKHTYMDKKRESIFYYVFYSFSDNAAGTPTAYWGMAWLSTAFSGGITMNFAQTWLNGASSQYYTNAHSAVLFHELGHTLGLAHGGNVTDNYKPNYPSMMNYLYSFSQPVIGSNSGSLYYNNKPACKTLYSPVNDHDLGESPDVYPIFFSNGSGSNLDENAVLESIGIGRAGGASIDFNCNGSIDLTPYALNLDDNPALTVISDFNDWSALTIFASALPVTPWNAFIPPEKRRHTTPHVLNSYKNTVKDLVLDRPGFVEQTERVGGVARGRDGRLYAIPAGPGMRVWMDEKESELLQETVK